VHVYASTWPANVAMGAATLLGVPFSISSYVDFEFAYAHALLAEKIARASFFRVVTAHCRERLLALPQARATPTTRIPVVLLGLDLANWQQRARPRGDGTLVSAARLVPKKGLHLMPPALAALRARGFACRWRVVGDGPERVRWSSCCAASTASPTLVTFLGPCDNAAVRQELLAADLAVLPCVLAADGERDGIPIFLCEAMALGVPVVSTPISGIPELIRDGDTGFLADAGRCQLPRGDGARAGPRRPGRDRGDRRAWPRRGAPRTRRRPPGRTAGRGDRAMNPLLAALLVLLLPVVWLGAVLFALLLLLVDLLATPFVWLFRRKPEDRAPATHNASIVVLNWNGLHFLRELMPSLRTAVANCPGDHEVIVVDNGSDDGSAEWLEREHGWARTLRLPENRYFIRGNAAGAALASRDLLVFLNNDMRVEPDWLVRAAAAVRRRRWHPVRDHVAHRDAGPPHRDRADALLPAARRDPLRAAARRRPGAPVPALWAGGGCSAFDRRKHDALGGFEDLYYPMYVEDVSLSWQAWRRGWRTVYVHDSVVHHAHRGSSTKKFGRERLERLNWRNRELFFVRSVTDPLLVATHALCFGWNLQKHARLLGLPIAHGVLAALATLPRLPRALVLRTQARRHHRRSDRELLRLVNGG
jgi:GT2 family glycosyltransferase